jgi:hypothetical protein
MDPDIEFWQVLLTRFNAAHSRDARDYNINTWLTARVIATTLCSQPYRAQIKHQQQQSQIPKPPNADENDEFSRLLAAIDDCRHMSQRRQRRKRLLLQQVGTTTQPPSDCGDEAGTDNAPPERARDGVLARKPQTMEEYEELKKMLKHICAQSKKRRSREVSKGDELPAGTGTNHNRTRKRKRAYPESPSQTAGPETADGTRFEASVPQSDSNNRNNSDGPQVANQKIKRSKKRRRNRPRDRDRHLSLTKERRDNDPASQKPRPQEIERRLRDLERMVKGMRRPR